MRNLQFEPLTLERWPDLETLFGPRGACGGCWCMWLRLKRSEFERSKGEPNRRSLRKLVRAGGVPGLLAYRAGTPVGWCAVEPRTAYPVLARSRTLKPIDGSPVWSVTCFFVAKQERGRGTTVHLLRAAVDWAREQGAEAIEGYPVVPKGRMPEAFAWRGLVSVFRKVGFVEAARRTPASPIMRLEI